MWLWSLSGRLQWRGNLQSSALSTTATRSASDPLPSPSRHLQPSRVRPHVITTLTQTRLPATSVCKSGTTYIISSSVGFEAGWMNIQDLFSTGRSLFLYLKMDQWMHLISNGSLPTASTQHRVAAFLFFIHQNHFHFSDWEQAQKCF